MSMEVKPVILVLGGTGFIGRNLVDYLVRNELAEKVIAVDKRIPEMAWLCDIHKESFKKVIFIHASLIKPHSISSIFDKHPGINFVINCAGETKPGQISKIYEEGIYELSMNCARECARRDVRCYVELSSSLLASYEKSVTAADLDKVDDKLQYSQINLQKLKVERQLRNIPNLRYVVARLAVVYGYGDVHGLTPHLIFAGVCKYTKEPLQMLWHRDHVYNTVHVDDVSRALVHLCHHGDHSGCMYYLADKSQTTQGLVAELIGAIFHIDYSFLGTFKTTLARQRMEEVTEGVLEDYLPPWMEACQKDGVLNTPLYPSLIEDFFFSNTGHIDGTVIEESTGFVYQHPHLTLQLLNASLTYYIDLNLYPSSLMSSSSSSSSLSHSLFS